MYYIVILKLSYTTSFINSIVRCNKTRRKGSKIKHILKCLTKENILVYLKFYLKILFIIDLMLLTFLTFFLL